MKQTKNKQELKIVTHDINWLKIIKLALNREGWGKTYTLYKEKTTTVTCYMREFNFPKNTATFIMTCNYTFNGEKYGSSEWHNYKTIEYHLDNFTIKFFKALINKKLISLLNDIIEIRTTKEAETKFDDLRFYAYDLDVEKKAKEFDFLNDLESINSINDENLKVQCLDELTNKLRDLSNKEFNLQVKLFIKHNSVNIEGFNSILDYLKKSSEVKHGTN